MSICNLMQTLRTLSVSTARSVNSHSNVKRNLLTSEVCHNFLKRDFSVSSVCQRMMDTHKRKRPTFPSSRSGRWVMMKRISEQFEYTTKRLRVQLKTGGRGPNGRIWFFHRGGGHKRLFRMIDWVRGGPSNGPPLEEKVEHIYYDPNRTAKIALVASGERKRYVIATQHMKPGDIIRSSTKLTKDVVKANEGDSYPMGSLPLGTFLNSVQIVPGEEARYATSAGVSAVLMKKVGNMVIVRLPSKREFCVSNKCTATVGRVSNIDHNKRVIGKAGRNRWLGIRPKSGRWHRKEGKHGRKIKPIKPMQKIVKQTKSKREAYSNEYFTLGTAPFLKWKTDYQICQG